MGRRPELKVGELYHIKAHNEWDFEPAFNCNGIYGGGYHGEEYLGHIISKGDIETSFTGAAIRVYFRIVASTRSDIPPSRLSYDPITKDYPWNQSWVLEYPATRWRGMSDRIVIQKFNPKKLPLYLNWGYGIETIRAMLKGTL